MVTKETKMVALADLIPCPDNPNNHPQVQVDAMSKSIETYGQYYPIVVDENMNILCGHGKYSALKALGRKEGEVCILKGLTKKQKRKIIVEDNKIQSMSNVNFEKMDAILKEVGELDVIGFSKDYLETILLDNIPDNMGIDFTLPLPNPNAPMSAPQAPANPEASSPTTQSNQSAGGSFDDSDSKFDISSDPTPTQTHDNAFSEINSGATMTRVLRCPHCGKEIVL